MFSKACEYGIRATLYIAQNSSAGNRVSLKEISEKIDSPEAFTAKILQQLARNQIIISYKGPNGGFQIDESSLETICLNQIVDAIDGDAIYRGCGLGLHECNANEPCPLHDQFMTIRNELKKMLESTTLGQLTEGLLEGITCLKR
ncbi:MAG: Rrf2 family transcriptional regulator [Flavobacteriales bacterium]|nr:Rrf2 family transcriptional regulator [Flavobacteriales bacterium]